MAIAERRLLQGRYDLRSQLGSGGMGSVWLAQDLMLERKVALKELLQVNNSPDRAERRARALREARAMARVKHRAIVKIHDVFLDDDDDPWLVMEYIKGRSLSAIIEEHTLDERATAAMGLPVLNGLRAAHRADVVHRDVKPANILVADDESIFLVDFGIAKIAGDAALTGQSKILGTTEFIAPERLLGQKVTSASDLWSLGVTFFYALEGYSPFVRHGVRNAEAIIAAILRDDPPPLRRQGALAEMVRRLLHKDPARRPSGAELAAVLRSVAAGATSSQVKSAAARTTKPLPDRAGQPVVGAAHQAGPTIVKARADSGSEKFGKIRIADDEAAKMLGMSHERAARQLAECPPRVAADILQGIAASRPDAAGAILQMISLKGAGRTMNHLTADAAASILSTMPVSAAVRILNSMAARTAGTAIMALSTDVASRLVESMDEVHAAEALGYVEPSTAAAMLSALNDPNRRLLARLSPSVRARVLRQMQPR